MKLISLCKAAIKKWGQTSQLDKSVEEISELIVAIKKVHFVRNPVIELEDGYELIGSEVADVETMFIQMRLMLFNQASIEDISLEELEMYDLNFVPVEHYRTLIQQLSKLIIAIEDVAAVASKSRKKTLRSHLDAATHTVTMIKSGIPNQVMLKIRQEKAHKFANYLG